MSVSVCSVCGVGLCCSVVACHASGGHCAAVLVCSCCCVAVLLLPCLFRLFISVEFSSFQLVRSCVFGPRSAFHTLLAARCSLLSGLLVVVRGGAWDSVSGGSRNYAAA